MLHDVKDRAARRHGDSDGVARRRGSICGATGSRTKRYLILDCHIDVSREARGTYLLEACTMCACIRVGVCNYMTCQYTYMYHYCAGKKNINYISH